MAKRKSEKNFRFEDALCELESIARELEDGSIGLDESLAKFEQGVSLLRHCYGILDSAEKKIAVLAGFDDDGNPVLKPFDASATVEQGVAGRRKADSNSVHESPTDELSNRERGLF